MRRGKTRTLERMRNAVAALAVVGMTACGATSASIVEVQILPDAYVVDGKPITSATEAAKAAAYKGSREVRVTACSMMPTKRIIDFMAEIGPIRTGQLSLNSFEPGAPQCPK